MSEATIVRYQTRPDAADANQRLVGSVYAELERVRPEGLRYVTFRLADRVSFVHVALVDPTTDPLSSIAAFAEFAETIGDRVTAPPVAARAVVLGSYRLFG